jgi:hypothetical protein
MNRRQVLGAVGALALSAVMGVGADAAEKSKVAKSAKACCCDTCCCGFACFEACCCPGCCCDTCCRDTATGKVAADKTVKVVEAAKPSRCPVAAAKTAELKATVAR